MKCPNDQTTLQMTDRQGIEIDYCPECRGVWLDRGELDKIIERSASWQPERDRDDDRDRGRDDKPRGGKAEKADKPKKKKASSFLETLMEFGGEG
jgi:Zn-finger nucleic acid-binding protein